MPNRGQLINRVKAHRLACGWSQADLAELAGVSRAAVSAIEVNRLVPSVATVLALATAFGCTVEEMFGFEGQRSDELTWAWPPTSTNCRYWQARVDGRTFAYPVEETASGVVNHDGVYKNGLFQSDETFASEETLVLACCDPAAGLLANEYARSSGLRLIPLPRSSQQALSLLGEGRVHAAGLHLSATGHSDGNAQAVKAKLGTGFTLLRVVRWQDGLAVSGGLGARSCEAVLRSKARWVGRETGSGARQCLDQLLEGRKVPRLAARDHRGVAEAVRCGWADAGVCLRLVTEEAGLTFLNIREECYDLCFPTSAASDPRILALIKVLRSSKFRKLFGELPGYNANDMGEVRQVR